MTWSRLPAEHRALAALAGGLVFFVPVFLVAPADDWRVVVVAALAGSLTACLCWQHFPGWDLFAAGCAFAVAGRLHALFPEDWTRQATLLLPAALSWYAGARLTETWLVFPLGYEDRSPFGGSRRLREDLGRGLFTMLAVGLAGGLALTFFLPAAEPLAFPMGLALSLAAEQRWPIRRPLWPVLGLLMALPAAGALAQVLARRLALPPPALADPWLLGGLLTSGALVGLWLSRWKRGPSRPAPHSPVELHRSPRPNSSSAPSRTFLKGEHPS